MSEDEDAPGTWKTRMGLADLIYLSPAQDLLIPCVEGSTPCRYPQTTTSYLIQ